MRFTITSGGIAAPGPRGGYHVPKVECAVFALPSGVASGSCVIVVPAGKRFVIEQVWTAGSFPSGHKPNYTVRVLTAGQRGTIGFPYPLPPGTSMPASLSGGEFFVNTPPAKFYGRTGHQRHVYDQPRLDGYLMSL